MRGHGDGGVVLFRCRPVDNCGSGCRHLVMDEVSFLTLSLQGIAWALVLCLRSGGVVSGSRNLSHDTYFLLNLVITLLFCARFHLGTVECSAKHPRQNHGERVRLFSTSTSFLESSHYLDGIPLPRVVGPQAKSAL